VTTAIFTANGHLASPAAFTAGFRPAELAAAGLAILGAMAAAAVSIKKRAAPNSQVEGSRVLAVAGGN